MLPGPCGLYRYKDLQKGRYQRYFEIVNRPSQKCGLWLANLKIAEDRIPSLFAVFFVIDKQDAIGQTATPFVTKDGVSFQPTYDQATQEKRAALLQQRVGTFKTHWVRDAVFYFEAESDLRSLVLQRRRWLNGTNAGYIYILQNLKELVWDSPHSVWMKAFTTCMMLIQMVQIFVLSVGPGIFSVILFGTCQFLMTHYCDDSDATVAGSCRDNPGLGNRTAFTAWLGESPQIGGILAECLYLSNYLVFLWVHRIQFTIQPDGTKQKKAGSDFHGWSWALVTIFNGALVLMFVWSLILSSQEYTRVYEQIVVPDDLVPDDLGNWCVDKSSINTESEWTDLKSTLCKADIHYPWGPDLRPTPPTGKFCWPKSVARPPNSSVDEIDFEGMKAIFTYDERPDLDSDDNRGDKKTCEVSFVLSDETITFIDNHDCLKYATGHDPLMAKWDGGKLSLKVGKSYTTLGICKYLGSYPSIPCRRDSDCLHHARQCMKVCTNVYSRCGRYTRDGLKRATDTCANACNSDLDCNVDAAEKCFHRLEAPQGCKMRLFAMTVMAGYVMIPLVFAVIDMPISRSIVSPLLMVRSIVWYILFMPTFVSFFSAYSNNRLADVSWGQRAVEDGIDKGQQRIEASAKLISIGAIFINLIFAVVMTTVRLLWPEDMISVADFIMAAAGCTFVISFVSYVYKYACMVLDLLFTDATDNTGLGDDTERAFQTGSSSNNTGSLNSQTMPSMLTAQLLDSRHPSLN